MEIELVIKTISKQCELMTNDEFHTFWVKAFILEPGNRKTGREILKSLKLKDSAHTDKILKTLK